MSEPTPQQVECPLCDFSVPLGAVLSRFVLWDHVNVYHPEPTDGHGKSRRERVTGMAGDDPIYVIIDSANLHAEWLVLREAERIIRAIDE